MMGIFIRAPYDEFVTTETRFWHDSGVDLAVSSSGFRLDTQSLLSLLVGGLAFEAPARLHSAPRAPAGQLFRAFSDRQTALRRPDTSTDTYLLAFSGSVRGLAEDAPVDFLGMNIGEVTSIAVDFDPAAASFRTVVEVDIHPERIRSRGTTAMAGAGAQSREVLDRLVGRGLRAQLRTGNLLTGQLYVALDFFPGARPARLDWTRDPLELPTMPGGLEQLQGSVARILSKLDKVPADQMGQQALAAIGDLRALLGGSARLVDKLEVEVPGKMGDLMTEAAKALAAAQGVLSRDAPLQGDLRQALSELGRAARAFRVLSDYLERHPESLLRGKKGDRE
jgi:paraquat-inducible protein B